jgi:hypothetical protein
MKALPIKNYIPKKRTKSVAPVLATEEVDTEHKTFVMSVLQENKSLLTENLGLK